MSYTFQFRKLVRKTFFAFLLGLLVIAPLESPVIATGPDGSNCACCSHNQDILNATIVQLSGPERGKAVAQALSNEDVKLLRSALIAEGARPRVNEAEAYRATQEDESGTHEAVVLVIPFGGDPDYMGITYGKMDGRGEEAIAWSVYTLNDGTLTLLLYYVEDGEVKTTEVGTRSPSCLDCTIQCVQASGLSPWTVWTCVVACVACFTPPFPWPACLICGPCAGIVIGCAMQCCA